MINAAGHRRHLPGANTSHGTRMAADPAAGTPACAGADCGSTRRAGPGMRPDDLALRRLRPRGHHRRDPTGALDDYFGQCAVMLNCVDLAPTAPPGGRRRSRHGERVLEPPASYALSVMSTAAGRTTTPDRGRCAWACPPSRGLKRRRDRGAPGSARGGGALPSRTGTGLGARCWPRAPAPDPGPGPALRTTERNGHSTVRLRAHPRKPPPVRRNEAASEVLAAAR
ncbi:hypothetical protein QJS66_09835 [Kocuria rhizophila]|nr:hypothetical protein QJS66_09835 [Kocuria rhizophila]